MFEVVYDGYINWIMLSFLSENEAAHVQLIGGYSAKILICRLNMTKKKNY